MSAGGSTMSSSEPITRPSSSDLRDSYRYCRAITRRRARNFYFGLRLAPEPKRSALYAMYAWTRQADDLIDDATSPAEARLALDEYRQATTSMLEGSPNGNANLMWVAFADTVHRFGISEEVLHDLLEGQAEDLAITRRATFSDLYRYCYRVASTVGLICIEVWGYQEKEARQLAEWRGIAFQLTNILRDFVPDLEQGRVYLPDEDFDRFDLTPSQLREWSDPERSEAFLRFQIDRARTFYDRSAALERLIDPACASTAWAMTRIYRELLERIAEDPVRVVRGERVRLPRYRKLWTALSASWQVKRALR